PAERAIPGGTDTVADAIGLELLEHYADALPLLVLAGMHGDPESGLARLLEDSRVVAVPKVRILTAGDVDADDAAVFVGDGLLDEDRVQGLIECAVQTEDEPGFHRVVEQCAIEAADGGV